MRKTAVIEHFGTQQRVADALTASGVRITQRGVSAWKEIVPLGRAYLIEKVTKGALKVDMRLYQTEERSQ